MLYPCAPSHYPPPPLGKILYPFEISGEKREIDHTSLGAVYLLSPSDEALSYPIETMKLTLVSRPRCTEN